MTPQEITGARPMPFITAAGHHLHTRWIEPRDGSGPTLVFLHEGLGSIELWRDFPDRIAQMTGCAALVYSRYGTAKRWMSCRRCSMSAASPSLF
jgi:hypothetical protein